METLSPLAVPATTGAPGTQSGMTLVELMIALALFTIVIAAIYQTFTYQQEAYLQTESRVNMVQEARAAQFFLARDIKMAGYDPTTFARTGFNDAERGQIRFSMDIAGNGDTADSEITRFTLTSDTGTFNDGVCPTGTNCRLSREWCSNSANCGGLQPVAEGVEAIEFCYIIGNLRATTTPTEFERGSITSVIVSVLMRQSYRSRGYTDTTVYTPASVNEELTPLFIGDRPDAWGPFNDPFRRKLVVFEVKARNMGMNPYADF
jgi:type IV pilus assembly protein PilW